MSIMQSLQVSIFGLGIVFFVLIGLSFLVKLQSFVLNRIVLSQTISSGMKKTEDDPAAAEKKKEISSGVLVLTDVNEKTAAMIMAIVSDELEIPLSELKFKSIKALD